MIQHIRMPCGWLDWPVFSTKDPYSRKAAFLWIVDNAAPREGIRRTFRPYVDVPVGAVAVRTLELAACWLWRDHLVKKFLQELQRDRLVMLCDHQDEPTIMLISIVNYEQEHLYPGYADGYSGSEHPHSLTDKTLQLRNWVGRRVQIPRETRAAVLLKTNGCCRYCSESLLDSDGKHQFEVDHWIPWSKGGSDNISNLVPACIECNRRKRAMTGPQFLRLLRDEKSASQLRLCKSPIERSEAL